MGISARITARIETWLTEFLTRLLTRPSGSYEQRVPNSLPRLKSQLRKGDVILVEGDQRVSQVIKYLTTSSWSHSALYIGDELRRFDPERAADLDARFGPEARHLILEADNPGVVCVPLAKYMRYNIRVCRPRLRRADVDRVLDFAFGHIGTPYNIRHIVELSRFLLPVRFIPRRFRQSVLHHGGERSQHAVICSTLIARAFGSVGYPVLPRVTIDEIKAQASLWRRLVGGDAKSIRALYREEDPAFITPRDFDLSPYFDIVKINYVTEPGFDYRQIEWAQDRCEPAVAPVAPAPVAAPAPAASAAAASSDTRTRATG